MDTSLALAKDVLSKLGFRKYTLIRQVQNFIKYDESSLRRLAMEPKGDDDYLFKVRKELEEQKLCLAERNGLSLCRKAEARRKHR